MNRFFSPAPLWLNNGLLLVRIITGFFILYHGLEIFSKEKINMYLSWDVFKHSFNGPLLVYVGKAAELISGLLLFLGMFTRVAALLLAGTMAYVTFFVGHGKVWYEDQHPFLFVLLAMIFFFTGPGNLSMDKIIFKRKNSLLE